MRTFLFIISLAGLGLTLIPALLVFSGKIPITLHYRLMAVGALLYFASAPFWMRRQKGK
ncbi:hypothetical protein JW906_05525 [bacterium]|nr:hypothetical protein [bacterium]